MDSAKMSDLSRSLEELKIVTLVAVARVNRWRVSVVEIRALVESMPLETAVAKLRERNRNDRGLLRLISGAFFRRS